MAFPSVLRFAAIFLAVCVMSTWAHSAHSQEVPGCGALDNAYGPFDYGDTAVRNKYLAVVEAYHFTPEVSSLRSGRSGTVIGDLDYTLRAFPNHPGALSAIARYSLQGGPFPAVGSFRSAECYFMRAITYRPADEVVRLIYGNYLFKRQLRDEARRQYEEALRLAPTSVEINYNAGLFFLDIGDLARAKELAKFAYDNGYPLPGLKNKIQIAESAKTKAKQ